MEKGSGSGNNDPKKEVLNNRDVWKLFKKGGYDKDGILYDKNHNAVGETKAFFEDLQPNGYDVLDEEDSDDEDEETKMLNIPPTIHADTATLSLTGKRGNTIEKDENPSKRVKKNSEHGGGSSKK